MTKFGSWQIFLEIEYTLINEDIYFFLDSWFGYNLVDRSD